jgi:hypothetical protein
MSGNVLIKDLDPEKEQRAMKTLRSFLIDYGALVNFSTKQWRGVVIIIVDKSAVSVGSKSEGGNGVKGTEKDKGVGKGKESAGMSSGQRKALDTTGFRCVKEGKSYLIEIPHTFKIPALLEFVRVNLPMTSLIAEFSS